MFDAEPDREPCDEETAMTDEPRGRLRIRPSWIVLGGLGVVGLVLVGFPLGSLLYGGILLLCPLMMAGMHGGHGKHGGDASPSSTHNAEGADHRHRISRD
jgi:hypothetical protein